MEGALHDKDNCKKGCNFNCIGNCHNHNHRFDDTLIWITEAVSLAQNASTAPIYIYNYLSFVIDIFFWVAVVFVVFTAIVILRRRNRSSKNVTNKRIKE